MSPQRFSAWPRVLRSALILTIATVGSGALCLPTYLEGRDLEEVLDVATVQRDHLLDIEKEVRDFEAGERAVVQQFLESCDRLAPQSDPTPRLYETVNGAAEATDVEVLTCLVSQDPITRRGPRKEKSPESFKRFSIDMSGCCDADRIGSFLQAIQSSEILIVPTAVVLQRTDERFPKVLVQVTAHAYSDNGGKNRRPEGN